MAVYVIAEAGSCHDGDKKKALSLITVAAEAGADAVKFQYWSKPARMRERRHIEDPKAYVRERIYPEWLSFLRNQAKQCGLDFMCTAYLPEDVEQIAAVVDKFKISSFESRDMEFIGLHYRYNKDIIISCGMNGLKVDLRGLQRHVKYLHCVSSYPTPINEANLAVLHDRYVQDCIERDFDGFSDHTLSLISGAVAVSLGSEIIEKHFRLDNTSSDCPDYPHSLTPSAFAIYVRNIREAEQLIGDGHRRVMPSEADNVKHLVI